MEQNPDSPLLAGVFGPNPPAPGMPSDIEASNPDTTIAGAAFSGGNPAGDILAKVGQAMDNLFAKMESKFGNVPGVSARLQQAEFNVQNQLSSVRMAKVKSFRARIN
jgi:hypothetical protein